MKLSINTSVFLLLLVSIFSCSEDANPVYERFNLKGKVKSFTENIYMTEQIEDTRQRGEILATTEYNFDQKGFNTSNNQYFGNSELFSTSLFVYDSGVLLREENYNKTEKPMYTTTFKIISENEVQFERIINTGEKVTSGKNFIKNNKIVKSTLTMFNKSVEYEVITIVLEYNSNGDISSRTQSKKNGETETIYYKYTDFDKNGNWIKCNTYGKEGEQEPYNFLTREYYYY